MRWMAAAVLLTVSGLCGALAPVASAHAPGRELFRIADARVVEASGLGVGIASPSIRYLQNDSGDSARFFAVDGQTGQTRSVVSVAGAKNVDWEDLAVSRNARGVASIFLADIGDNSETRGQIQIYEVSEPHLTGLAEQDVTVPLTAVWRLRYPDGPVNAESLAVDPIDHRMYIFTKSLLGATVVYRVPATPKRSVQTLQRVAQIDFSFTGTPGGPNAVGQLTATGASMSADGSLLVVRTYTDAYFWPVSASGIVAALQRKPYRTALPPQPLGEGIALLGSTVLVDSEGVGSAVYALPLPAVPKSARTSSPPRSSTPASSSPARASSSHSGAGSPAGHSQLELFVYAVLGVAVVLGLTRLAVFAIRRRDEG
ncbi:hypothetical protein M6D93_12980 [Jatrophihabitans telluris]|uniref:Esterase-like activity of phytase family protein n=1 Tax=Jatrophihabitans telluris TaxID=2038343 RepID=A0ABY4QVE6_9ACTN|nr:hypothetical protein [Jatrophihabitans telluris]UQX87212.1 hypothetical protein M6D93_12980 [Jatrophihabitans telluris]